jgi:hypothetical protein
MVERLDNSQALSILNAVYISLSQVRMLILLRLTTGNQLRRFLRKQHINLNLLEEAINAA